MKVRTMSTGMVLDEDLRLWHEEQHTGDGPPPDPPGGGDPGDPGDGGGTPPPAGSGCKDPDWKWVHEGGCVILGGRLFNTRGATADRGNGIFWISQNNDTFTQPDPKFWSRGRVTFDLFLERGMVQGAGGGEHFYEHQSYVLQRSHNRQEAGERFARMEIANLSTRARLIGHGRLDGATSPGVATQFARWDAVAPEEAWFPVEIDYIHGENRLMYEVTMLGESHRAECAIDADPIGRYFMPVGHIDGHPKGAGVRVRDLKFL